MPQLHGPVKAALGDRYAEMFHDARFAQYGSAPRRRLDRWVHTLLDHLHGGLVPEDGAAPTACPCVGV
eukprot:gene33682-19898_t